MQVLATQASSGHLTDPQRQILASEFTQGIAAIDRVAQATVYNNRTLLTGFTEIDEEASTAITDAAGTGLVRVGLSGADTGTYTFTDSPDDSNITLSSDKASQTLNLGVILDNGVVAAGTQVIANFDRLGVFVTLAGANAHNSGGAGVYEAGNLSGKTLIVNESDSGQFQIGPSPTAVDQLSFELPDLRAAARTLDLGKVTLGSQRSARDALGSISIAIASLALERGKIGSLQNRLSSTISFTENTPENVTSAEASIRDADYALEVSELSRASILSDSSTAMLTAVLAFRQSYERYTKPDDVNRLLELFPRVKMRDGYVLDYVQEESEDGVMMPIRPFARPSDDSGWVPLFDAREAPSREDLADVLYNYVEFEGSAEGLFEYAFFIIELWAVRVSRHVAEWADSTPIFTAERFQRFIDEASKVSDLRKPEHYGPLSRLDEGGSGRVRFLVHTPVGWERIYYLESMVFSDGFVDQEAGEIVADMGTGQLF